MKELFETYLETILEIVLMSSFVGVTIKVMNMVFAI